MPVVARSKLCCSVSAWLGVFAKEDFKMDSVFVELDWRLDKKHWLSRRSLIKMRFHTTTIFFMERFLWSFKCTPIAVFLIFFGIPNQFSIWKLFLNQIPNIFHGLVVQGKKNRTETESKLSTYQTATQSIYYDKYWLLRPPHNFFYLSVLLNVVMAHYI